MIHLSQFDIHITVGNADGYVGDFSDVFLELPNFATLQAALDEVALHDSGLIFVYPGNYPVASDCNFRGRVAVRGLGSIPEDCFFYASSDNTPFRYSTDAEVFIENIHFRSSTTSWRHFILSAGTGWKLWGNKARWAHGNTSCHGVWIGTASRDDYTCKFTHCQLSSGYNFVARGRQSRFTFHRIYSDRVNRWCWQCTDDGWAEYDITTNASALDYGPSSGEFQIDLFEVFAGWIDNTSHSHTADGLLEVIQHHRPNVHSARHTHTNQLHFHRLDFAFAHPHRSLAISFNFSGAQLVLPPGLYSFTSGIDEVRNLAQAFYLQGLHSWLPGQTVVMLGFDFRRLNLRGTSDASLPIEFEFSAVEGIPLFVPTPRHKHTSTKATIGIYTSITINDARQGHTHTDASIRVWAPLDLGSANHQHKAQKVSIHHQSQVTAQDASHEHLVEEVSIRVWARVQAASADHWHSVQGLSLTHLSPLQGLDARSLHLVPQVRLTHRSFLELVSSRHEHFVSPAPVRHVSPLRHLEARHRHWVTRISLLPPGWQFTARAAVPFDLRVSMVSGELRQAHLSVQDRRASVAEQSRRAAISSEGRAVVVPLRVG